MIGIGKYKAHINNMFYKGEVIFELKWVNDSYDFDVEIDSVDFDMPEITIKSVEEDGESILCAIEDEQELQTVYDLIMDALYEEEDEE